MLCGIELKEIKGDQETQVITIARRQEMRTVTQTILVPLPAANVSKRLCVEASSVRQVQATGRQLNLLVTYSAVPMIDQPFLRSLN